MLELFLIFVEEVQHLLFGNHLSVDADALAEIHEVRRSEESGRIAKFLEI